MFGDTLGDRHMADLNLITETSRPLDHEQSFFSYSPSKAERKKKGRAKAGGALPPVLWLSFITAEFFEVSYQQLGRAK